MPSVKQLFIFLIAALLLNACGAHKREQNFRVDLSSSIVAGGQALSDSENAVALRICYAFKTKNTLFRAELVNKTFRMQVSQTYCAANKPAESEFINTILRAPFASSSMFFDSASSRPYFKDVQTDSVGPMKEFCELLVQGGGPPFNVFVLGGGEAVEYSFFSGPNDSYSIRYGKRKGSSDINYEPYKIERFEILTNATVAGSYYGLEMKSERWTTCSDDPKKSERFTQTFIE
jgi:hypothetical protein